MADKARKRNAAGSKAARKRPLWLVATIAGALLLLVVTGVLAVVLSGVLGSGTAEATLHVQVTEPRADVFIDGERMDAPWDATGKRARIAVRPGVRRVEVRKEGFKTTGGKMVLEAAEHKTFTASLQPNALVVSDASPQQPAQPPVVKGQASGSAFVPLFNAKDLMGWTAPPGQEGGWHVKDGLLVGAGESGGQLYSERADFHDFHLRTQARVSDGSNGGIFFRVPAVHPKRPARYLAQINSTHFDVNKTGSLHAGPLGTVVSVRESAVAPGAWFTFEVIAHANRMVVKVNNRVTADYVDEKNQFAGGHVALHHYSRTVVEFKAIELQELSAQSTPFDAGRARGQRTLFLANSGWPRPE